MNELIRVSTADLARFLEEHLPAVSPDWWQKHVVNRLSFQQQRTVQERGMDSLQRLDFAALLRVLDQNWFELSNAINLPREGRNWLKELQTVRNRWAHLSSEAIPPSELYRDADTLGRFLAMIGAGEASVAAVESTKATAVAAMAGNTGRSGGSAPAQAQQGTTRSTLASSGMHAPSSPAPPVSRPAGAPVGQHTVFGSFEEFMDSVVLPRQAAHSDHRRLDGQPSGSNKDVVGRFRHEGSVWRVHADSHYEPLLLAYDAATRENSSPFVIRTTAGGSQSLALRDDLQRRRTSQHKDMYMYRD
jgi:hypothetical protein